MIGLFSFIGWILFYGSFIIGFITGLSSDAGAGFLVGIGLLVASAPFIGGAEIIERLAKIQALNEQANGLHGEILAALNRNSGKQSEATTE